jgi:PTH1 family peptidyl-tRNA hydrolase
MSKFLIAGLGNIGDEYLNTRHNIGFKAVDAVAEAGGGLWRMDRLAAIAEVKFRGKLFILIKPSTFMNLSGKAINYWLQAEKISVENLLVVTDDIALPFGKLRMKGKGSDGGHNGLKSTIENLNTDEFARLRFGVGSDFFKGKQSDHVLGEWTAEEKTALPARIGVAVDMIKGFGTIGLQRTMTFYNNK